MCVKVCFVAEARFLTASAIGCDWRTGDMRHGFLGQVVVGNANDALMEGARGAAGYYRPPDARQCVARAERRTDIMGDKRHDSCAVVPAGLRRRRKRARKREGVWGVRPRCVGCLME